LMRNGRDRRSGKPAVCHAIDKRVLLVGTRSADYIRASGQSGCIERPDTWLHPNASLRRQIPLATRAPSIHGTHSPFAALHKSGSYRRFICRARAVAGPVSFDKLPASSICRV